LASKKDSSATRRRIAEVAAGLFAERGFAETSVRHICKAADITAPTLYYHFGSKDGLIEAIVFETLTTFLGDVESLDAGSPLEEAIHDLTLRVFRFGAERPAVVRLIGLLDATPLPAGLRAETTRLQRESMASIATLFEQASERRELPQVDAMYCAASFVGLVMFQMTARERTPKELLVGLEEAARQLTSYVIAGARGAPPRAASPEGRG
jgi:AcrR family transcriptional regulator